MGLSVLESRQTPRRLASAPGSRGLRAGAGRPARSGVPGRRDHRPSGRRRAVVRLRVHPLPRSAAVDGGPAGRRPLPAPPATGSWAGEAHRADQGGRPGALLRLPHRPLRQRDPGGHRLHPRPADRRVQPAFQSGLWGGASPPTRGCGRNSLHELARVARRYPEVPAGGPRLSGGVAVASGRPADQRDGDARHPGLAA